MSRRGESIYKRKDGRWEARYVKGIDANGNKKYGSVYANTYREVKDKRYYILNEKPQIYYSVNICIKDLIVRWLEHIRNQVKYSTYRKYEGLSYNHIISKIGDIPLIEITRITVERFADNELKSGKAGGGELSPKTVNDILIVLSRAFAFAGEEYGINMPRISLIRVHNKEAQVLSVLEQKQLTAYITKDMDIYKFGVLLALYTGIRIGELCALKWEDITDECVKITKTMQRLKGDNGKTEIMIGEPKSNSSKRIVPLPTFLKPYISLFRQSQGYVLYTNKTHICEPRTMQFKFREITRASGIGDVNFHVLRHTFATRCVEAGFDVKSLSEILGHSDVKTTLNRYVHSSFELKQSNMEKLSLCK